MKWQLLLGLTFALQNMAFALAPPPSAESSFERSRLLAMLPGQSLENEIALREKTTRANAKSFDDWYRLGLAYGASGQFEKAVSAQRNAVKLQPRDFDARFNLAAMLFKAGLGQEAVTHFKQTTELRPESADAWNGLALGYHQIRKKREAQAALQKAFQLDQNQPHIWNTQGLLHAGAQQWKEALAAFDRAVALDERYAPGWHNRAFTLYYLKDRAGLTDSLRRAIASDASFHPARLALVMALLDAGQTAEAGEQAREIVRRQPQLGAGHYLLGVARGRQQQWTESEQALRQAEALGFRDADLFSALGLAMTELGRLDEAEKALKQALAIQSRSAGALLNLGVLRSRQARWKEARDCYRKSLSEEPQNSQGWKNLAQAAGQQKDFDESANAAAKAVELAPDDAESWYHLGLARAGQQQLEASREALRKTVELNPRLALAWAALAAHTPDPAAAVEAARKAYELEPKREPVLFEFSRTLIRANLLDDAITTLQTLVAVAPNSSEGYQLLAQALLLAKKAEQAVAAAQRAADLQPDAVSSWQTLGVALFEAKRFAEAAMACDRGIALAPREALLHCQRGEAFLQIARGDVTAPSFARAEEAFAKATQLDPQQPRSWQFLHFCQQRQGRTAEAEKTAKKITALGAPVELVEASPASTPPQNFEECISRAQPLMAQGRLAEGLPLLLQAHALRPNDFYLVSRIAEAYRLLDQAQAGIDFAQKSTERFPEEAKAWHTFGNSLYQARRLEEALPPLRKAVELNARDAENWLAEGTVLAFLQRWGEAIPKLEQAVRLSPAEDLCWQGLFGCYHTTRDFLPGEAKLKELLLAHPDAAPGWHYLAVLQFMLGTPMVAQKNLEKSLQLRPNYAEAWSTTADLLQQAGEYPKALEARRRAVEGQPENAMFQNNLGWTLHLNDQTDEAIAGFEKALERDPRHALALVNLTRMWIKKGDREKARAVCERLAQVDEALGTQLRSEISP